MVSKIGMPVVTPAMLQIKVATQDGIPMGRVMKRIEEITTDRLAYIPCMVDDFVAGRIELF
jgi:S-adenosylmethionine synthetase